MNKLEALLEGERRGILPPDKLAILQESRRRGLIPGQGPKDFAQKSTFPMEAQEQPVAPAPQDRGVYANMLTDYQNQLLGAAQGTSPIAQQISGEMNYQPLGEATTLDSGEMAYMTPDGKLERLDPQSQIILRDRSTGKPMAYSRNPDMDEGRLLGLTRVLSPGFMTSPATPLTRGAAAVPKVAPMTTRAAEMADVGIQPSLMVAAKGGTIPRVAQALAQVPGAATIIKRGMERTTQQAGQAVQALGQRYGLAKTAEQAGEAIGKGIEAFKTRFGTTSARLYDKVAEAIPSVRQFDLKNSTQLLTDIQGKFPSSPTLAGMRTAGPMKQTIEAITESGGKLTFPEIKELRSFVGEAIRNPKLMEGVPAGDLKALYGALSDDMAAAASEVGGQALTAWQRANSFYKARAEQMAKLESIWEAKSPEQAFAKVLNAASANASKADINKLLVTRKAIGDEAWGDVAAAILNQAGKQQPGKALLPQALSGTGEFSPTTFVTQIAGMAPEARKVIFGTLGPELAESFEKLTRVMGYQKGLEALRNTSNTGSTGANLLVGAGAVTNWPATVGGLITAAGGAKAVSSPAMMKFIARTAEIMKAPPRMQASLMTQHMATLKQLSQSAPEFAEDIPRLQVEINKLLQPNNQTQ